MRPPDFSALLAFDKRVVHPMCLDAATDGVPQKDHVILHPSDRPLLEPLFVFLGGSSGRPANNQRILEIAARAGYRSVGRPEAASSSGTARIVKLSLSAPGLNLPAPNAARTRGPRRRCRTSVAAS